MNKLLLGSTLATALLTGCAVDEPTYSTNQGVSWEEFRASVGQEPGTGYFIVDWDIVLPTEERLYEYWASSIQGGLLLYRLNGTDIKWNDTQKLQLTYCVSTATFGANKQMVLTAMQNATVNGWEKFANIKFVYKPDQDANCTAANPNVLFDVNQVNSGGQYLARAFFPNSPRAERNVLIDPGSYNAGGGVTLTNIIIHELGHTLGFRHEHIRNENPNRTQNCTEDLNYNALTTYDTASTMHYPQCGAPGNTLALSPRDQQGVALVYGAAVGKAPVASISIPTEGAEVGPNFTVVPMVMDTDNNIAKVELYIDGVLAGSSMTAPYSIPAMNVALGTRQLTIKAIDSTNLTVTTTVTTVTVKAGGGDPGNPNNPTNPTDPGDEPSNDVTGGCSTGGGSAGILFGLGLLGLAFRRRR